MKHAKTLAALATALLFTLPLLGAGSCQRPAAEHPLVEAGTVHLRAELPYRPTVLHGTYMLCTIADGVCTPAHVNQSWLDIWWMRRGEPTDFRIKTKPASEGEKEEAVADCRVSFNVELDTDDGAPVYQADCWPTSADYYEQMLGVDVDGPAAE